jgi:integrase/recombinase XerD
VAASRQASLAPQLVSPRIIRHITALHRLQSGVELNVIKAWLGHVSITTTSQCVEIDMAMKRTPRLLAKAQARPSIEYSSGTVAIFLSCQSCPG